MNRHTYFLGMLLAFVFVPLISVATPIEASLMSGPIFSELSNNRTVQVDPAVTNAYITDEDTQSGTLLGLNVGYRFDNLAHNMLAVTLGVGGYYLNYGYIAGIEQPFINAGVFDTLDYHYKAKSYAVMFEPKLTYTQFDWQPYIFVGLGSAWNRLYNYGEKPTNPAGTAAPASNPFSSNTVNAFAYEAGIGIQHEFGFRHVNMFRYRVSADYRYMNMGNAQLGTMPTQTTSDHLEVSPLYTQAVVISFTTLF